MHAQAGSAIFFPAVRVKEDTNQNSQPDCQP